MNNGNLFSMEERRYYESFLSRCTFYRVCYRLFRYKFRSQCDYSIEQTRDCFCPQGGQPVKLFVASDTIAEAVWISDNTRLSWIEWQRFRTISGLFNEIDRWDTSSSFSVHAEYDTKHNFPSYISITPKPNIVNDTISSIIKDAGVSYRTWNFVSYR